MGKLGWSGESPRVAIVWLLFAVTAIICGGFGGSVEGGLSDPAS